MQRARAQTRSEWCLVSFANDERSADFYFTLGKLSQPSRRLCQRMSKCSEARTRNEEKERAVTRREGEVAVRGEHTSV